MSSDPELSAKGLCINIDSVFFVIHKTSTIVQTTLLKTI